MNTIADIYVSCSAAVHPSTAPSRRVTDLSAGAGAIRAWRMITRVVVVAMLAMLFAAPADARSRQKKRSDLPRPVKMGSYGTYEFRFPLWRNAPKGQRAHFLDWTPAQMMSELNSNFSRYFTFTGCGRTLRVGQRCNLKAVAGLKAPVQVIAVASDGFALRSLPGHPEGKNRTIRFQFQRFTNAAEVTSMSLLVQAWGPVSKGSVLGPLNSNTVAKGSWNIFQNNIRSRFPTRSPNSI